MLSKFSGASFFTLACPCVPDSHYPLLVIHVVAVGLCAPYPRQFRAIGATIDELAPPHNLSDRRCLFGFAVKKDLPPRLLANANVSTAGQSLRLMPGSGAANLQREICLRLLNAAQAMRR